MIESLTIITLVFLYLHFFRPGKTPQLESPLVIERPGKYKITLAPKLNLAQPFIESIAARIAASADATGSSTQFFAVRDKQVATRGREGFLLIVSCQNGMLHFQAEQPLSDDRSSHLEWLSDFTSDVLTNAPARGARSTALDSCIIAAIQNVAREQGVDVNLLHVGGITIRQQALTHQNNSFDFCG